MEMLPGETSQGVGAAPAAQGPSSKGGLRLEPLEAKHSETGGQAHGTSQRALRRSGFSTHSVCYAWASSLGP